jgi:flavin reductase (DIM6/NTAB) family NADH-FMN oxidoreductase RutF
MADARLYRRAMSLFATGVGVIAVQSANNTITAMTANSVASVSLDPLLLLLCVEKVANMAEPILTSDGFSLCLLSDQQQSLSDYFAGLWRGNTAPDFTFSTWEGGPLLAGCIAAVGCTRYQTYEGGDHWIILGKVNAIYKPEITESPLIFYKSAYRRLNPI